MVQSAAVVHAVVQSGAECRITATLLFNIFSPDRFFSMGRSQKKGSLDLFNVLFVLYLLIARLESSECVFICNIYYASCQVRWAG